MDFSKLSDRERLIAEQAVQTLRALDQAADAAPHGQGLSFLEATLHDKGFTLLRSILTASASARPEAQKGVCIRDCSCGGHATFKACQTRQILTTVGHIDLPRRRYHCRACGGSIPLDAWAGVGQRSITPGARRLLTLAGTSWSFDNASRHLKEFCHLTVSDDTIERVCQEEGKRAQTWMNQSPEPARAFAQARGRAELSSDGVQINTIDGWREMRLTTLAKREAALPCAPENWADRPLNRPQARFSICQIADANHVGASWRRLSQRMRLADEAVVNLQADGAKWIWDQAAQRLPRHNAKWCVDVYHVGQHLHQCGRELHGEGKAARDWADRRLMTALRENGPALIGRIQAEAAAQPEGSAWAKSMGRLLTFLRPNADRMWYRDRLHSGDPIGSGMIEGGCKNTIGARLKLNSARWRVRRAERIGTLRCVDASDQWEYFWKIPA